jgi:nickel-dependent lactate racemase
MEVRLKYGRRVKTLSISDNAETTILQPASMPVISNLDEVLDQALDHPLGTVSLQKRRPPQSVAIAVPDESRAVPFGRILPGLLKKLRAAYPRLKSENVTIVIAGGLHPPMDKKTAAGWVPGEMAPGCRVISHDAGASPMIDFGRTRRSTPIAINAEYARSDLKLLIGQIDPHQFVGFTGGAKGVVIGCGAEKTIEHNHGLMFHDGAVVGRLEGNPVREDLNEAGRILGLDLVVNVVLDPDQQVVGLWAGDPEAVLREGARTCARVYGVAINQVSDLAVASCGGYPKDICLYQAQKGLNLASHAVKPGGKILLLAACEQGVGDDVYYEYVRRFPGPREALDAFKQMGFKMGAHKSYLFSRTLSRYTVVVDSQLDSEVLGHCHLTAGAAQATLDRWIADFAGRPKIAVVPSANTTYFYPA